MKNDYSSFRVFIHRSAIIIIAVGMNLFLLAQSKEKEDKNEPEVHIKVQKETDENGNTTRYDSTYSWTWSGRGQLPDEINQKLLDLFKHNTFPDNFPFSDSIMESLNGFDPFQDDTFSKDHFFDDNFYDPLMKMDESIFKQMEKILRDSFWEYNSLTIPPPHFESDIML